MNNIWNKTKVYVYELHIGNFIFTINTHIKDLQKITWNHIECNKSLPMYNIIIWIDDNKEYITLVEKKMQQGNLYLPNAIRRAYRYLKINDNAMKNRINKFVVFNDMVYVHFRFPCEDFYLVYSFNNLEIYIIGNEINLERIIIDFLSMTAKSLPLHAGCVSIEGQTAVFLGDVNSGKTSIVLEMLKLGASYISDDILYFSDGFGIRCSDYISVRKEYLPLDYAKTIFYTKADKHFLQIKKINEKLNYYIKNCEKVSNYIILSPMKLQDLTAKRLFCIFFRDSMWCLDIIGRHLPPIEDIIESSDTYYQNLLNKSNVKTLEIDFSCYQHSVLEAFQQIKYS